MALMSDLTNAGGTLGISWPSLIAIMGFAYIFIIAVYRWKFHQLSIYPGPILWSISRLPNSYYHVKGKLPFRLSELHEQYGPVIRIAPNELSYINAEAWSDIYGAGSKGKSQLLKNQKRRPKAHSGVDDIIMTPLDSDHARMRRNFAQGFTSQSLREQEPLLNKYFNLLITKLREKADDGPVDMAKFYNFTTFDIIGDLTFGESFGCLEDGVLHRWVQMAFQMAKSMTLLGVLMNLSNYALPLLSLIPCSREPEKYFRKFTYAKLDKRLARQEPRSDFMSIPQKTINTPEGMTLQELRENTTILIIAGSETTATLLTGVTYYLLLNASIYEKLKSEIRSEFKSNMEITDSATQNLPYLHAVIQEALRIFPPVPATFARQTPPSGSIINGKFVAGNTILGVQQYSANHSPSNFYLPEEFIPERWMGDERFVDDKRSVVQPFHVGPRNCIGKMLAWTEMRCILARVIWNFELGLEGESRRRWGEGLRIYSFWEKPELLVRLKEVER